MSKPLKFDESIDIARPLPEVFEFVSNPDNVTAWNSNLDEYTLTSGSADQVGAVFAITVKVAGIRLSMTEELTGYESNSTLAYRSKESKIGYTREVAFTGIDGGTRVTSRMESEADTGLFKFGDPIVQKLYEHDLRSNLEKAKTILES